MIRIIAAAPWLLVSDVTRIIGLTIVGGNLSPLNNWR